METYKNIPPQERKGYIYFLKGVQINKRYYCKEGCSPYFQCCIVPNPKKSFVCSEISFHIIATTSVEEDKYPWRMDERNFLVIGTDGLVYKGTIPCDKIEGIQRHLQYGDEIYKRSQADIVLHFPELPDGVEVREIIVRGNPKLTFTIAEDNDDEYNLESYLNNGVLTPPQPKLHNGYSDDFTARKNKGRGLIYELNLFKTLVFQRFNTRLTSSEKRQIEDEIGTQMSVVEQYFNNDKEKNSPELQALHNEFREQAAYYRFMYSEKIKAERELLIRIMSVSDILNVSPDEFERLCSEVMVKMGYYDVIVTPHSNDKGIDVYGKMDGELIVAQCKRFRDSVGTPDMQRFIGAMHTAGAKKGIFFTTAVFTSEAKNMAYSSGITLFDKTAFANFLSLHSFLDVQKDTPQPSLWDDDLPE